MAEVCRRMQGDEALIMAERMRSLRGKF